MIYERLTKRCNGVLHVFDVNDHEIPLSEVTALDLDLIVGHLVFLEDKIESGEIVNRNDYLDHLSSAKLFELSNNEIEFFVNHNAKIRKYTDEAIIHLTTENAALRKQIEEMRNKQ